MNTVVLEASAAENSAGETTLATSGAPEDAVSVLIISTSAYLRVWIGRLLEREPGLCVIDRVSSVGQGVRLARRFHPDLVVCDPRAGRDAFLATMFADGACTRTRVVVIDSEPATPNVAGFTVPVDAVLHQDVSPLHMAQAFRRLGGLEQHA